MRRPLTKSSQNIVITGTLAGIAEWIGIDPTILRVIYVILSFFSAGFPGFMLYIILAIVIPSSRRTKYKTYNRNTKNANPYEYNKNYRKEAEKSDDDWSDF